MSDPWPSSPPGAPPVSDYPLRLLPPAAPAPHVPTPAAPTPGPAGPGGPGGPASPWTAPAVGTNGSGPPLPGAGPSPRRVALVAVALILVVALAATGFALARPDGTDAAAPGSTAKSSTSTTRTPRSSTTTTEPDLFDPFDSIPGLPELPDLFPPSTPAPPPASDEDIRAEVADLQAFVEEHRGLTFDHDVEVEVLPPDDFRDRVLDEFEKESGALEEVGHLYRAMGLLDPSSDPVGSQRNLLGDAVLGFYDPTTEALVVRGTAITPKWREITVHELTHALDDQRMNLDRPDVLNADDGRAWAFQALVEGSASRVQKEFVASLSQAELQQRSEEEFALGQQQLMSSMSVSLTLMVVLQSPYSEGEPFVSDLEAAGGTTAIDDAFADPPTTAEQILHPDTYRAREGAKPVDAPTADGPEIGRGVLGQYLTGALLATGSGTDSIADLLNGLLTGEIDPNDLEGDVTELLDDAVGLDPPDGWGGDAYVLWEDGSRSCMRVNWVWDTPADRDAFVAALDDWTTTAGRGATVDTSNPDVVTLTRCA